MAVTGEQQAAIGASAMRKAFWRIIPLILVDYLFAYMDRVNVSFAAADMVSQSASPKVPRLARFTGSDTTTDIRADIATMTKPTAAAMTAKKSR